MVCPGCVMGCSLGTVVNGVFKDIVFQKSMWKGNCCNMHRHSLTTRRSWGMDSFFFFLHFWYWNERKAQLYTMTMADNWYTWSETHPVQYLNKWTSVSCSFLYWVFHCWPLYIRKSLIQHCVGNHAQNICQIGTLLIS